MRQTVYFGAINQMAAYFMDQGVPIPSDTNPAEFMIDVVSGDKSKGRDWAKVWLGSHQRHDRMAELYELTRSNSETEASQDDNYEFASSFRDQVKIVCDRAFVQVGFPSFHQSKDGADSLAVARCRVCHEQISPSHQ